MNSTPVYVAKRPAVRSALVFFIIAGLLLAACGGRLAVVNWPGLVADDNVVYVAYGPAVIAYDVAAEEQLWTFPTEGRPGDQFYAAPSVQDDLIVIGDYGTAGGMLSPGVKVSIYALGQREEGTPSTVWVAGEAAKDKIVAAPLQTETQVFVGTADNELLALDKESGELLWRFPTSHSIWAQPVYQDGIVYLAGMDKNLYAISAETGEEQWRTTLGGSIANRPVIDGDTIYVGSFDKKLHALDLATGDEKWTAAATDWVWASPAVANGVVYYADIKANVYAVSSETGEMQWSKQLDEGDEMAARIQATPVVVEDTVYLALIVEIENIESGLLVALSAEDGEEQWRETTPAPLFTTPVVAGDSIVVALQSTEALLLMFDLEGGGRRTFLPPSAE